MIIYNKNENVSECLLPSSVLLNSNILVTVHGEAQRPLKSTRDTMA